jgi:3-deoxy-7-phosphoheptulonate synthase
MTKPTQNLNITEVVPLISPRELKSKLPISPAIAQNVLENRKTIEAILTRKDKRFLVVVGPCSIYDAKAAIEYARKLKKLSDELKDKLFIVMRVYFEKPRTTVGWKGYLNDPHLTGHGDISEGLFLGRKLLLDITGMGLPVATEVLDPIVPQYLSDMISWASIGARTTESQTHREMASGLSMPVGFKNSTEGNLEVAINAMEAARHPHHFLGINQEGQTSIVKTKGNLYGHVILRGGRQPNYDEKTIISTTENIQKAGFDASLMIDCSHGNSMKKHENQEGVCRAVIDLKNKGHESIIGVLMESNLFEGNQKIPADISQLKYGVSITDACMGWDTTEALLKDVARLLK